jgi:hypothetical protein
MFPVPPRVKVCCIASEEEAALAVRLGASAIGLVSRMPSGPGPIPEPRIRDIARTVPPGVATFLLTCETTAELIIEQQRFGRTTTLQLVDGLEQKDSRLGGRSESSQPSCAEQSSEHEPDGSSATECTRDRVERARWEAGAFGDSVYRLPFFGIELRLECIEPIKVVEPRAV